MAVDSHHIVEQILRMSENVDEKAILKEMLRIAEEGDVAKRLTRLFVAKGVDHAQAVSLLDPAPEDISTTVINSLREQHLNVVDSSSAAYLATILRRRLSRTRS